MKIRLFSFLLSLLITVVSSLFTAVPFVLAADAQPDQVCAGVGTYPPRKCVSPVNGKTYECVLSIITARGSSSKCTDVATIPTCTCTFPGDSSSGRNGFICKDASGNTLTPAAYCPHVGYSCSKTDTGTYYSPDYAKPVKGITCSNRNGGFDINRPQIKQPSPPPPPCSAKTPEGQCAAVDSGLGSFAVSSSGFISRIFGIMLGVSGVIALILIMRAGYAIMTARGNPQGIQKGREQLVAAIVGLLFIVFAFVLLQVIANDLLKIASDIPIGTGGLPAGSHCNMTGASPCGSGLLCVSDGTAQGGFCMLQVDQSCDMAGNFPQCPPGQTCTALGSTRAGVCK